MLHTLEALHNFFLLERGEFAIALITAADQYLKSRQMRTFTELLPKDADRLGRILIKEGEATAVLARAWTTLVALQVVEDADTDEELELAREHRYQVVCETRPAAANRRFIC